MNEFNNFNLVNHHFSNAETDGWRLVFFLPNEFTMPNHDMNIYLFNSSIT